MSCNGCRVLRKGCSETCVLRSCLHWIESPEAQGNATLFLAKFFGRSDLMSLISAVPHHHRSALFQSLLYEACGRTVNPVNGAVGLLSGGNWHVCQAAVQTVLAGGTLRPIPGVLTALWRPSLQDESSEHFYAEASTVRSAYTQWQPWIVSNAREQDRECGLGLPPTMRPRGGRRGKGRSYQVAVGRPSACPPASFYSGESETTSLESGEDDPRIQGVQQQRELLNLFV